jgi:hypothetical protein
MIRKRKNDYSIERNGSQIATYDHSGLYGFAVPSDPDELIIFNFDLGKPEKGWGSLGLITTFNLKTKASLQKPIKAASGKRVDFEIFEGLAQVDKDHFLCTTSELSAFSKREHSQAPLLYEVPYVPYETQKETYEEGLIAINGQTGIARLVAKWLIRPPLIHGDGMHAAWFHFRFALSRNRVLLLDRNRIIIFSLPSR